MVKISTLWSAVAAKLPTGLSPAERQTRAALWSGLTFSGRDQVSLDEVGKFVDVLQIDVESPRAKPVLQGAIDSCKGLRLRSDVVERSEFRSLLINIRVYLELYVALASGAEYAANDRRVSFSEFQRALPLLAQWGARVGDARAAFGAIGADRHDHILFADFARWALERTSEAQVVDDDENEPPAEQPAPPSPRRTVGSPYAQRPSSPRLSSPRPSSPRPSSPRPFSSGQRPSSPRPSASGQRPSSPRLSTPRSSSPRPSSPRPSSPRRPGIAINSEGDDEAFEVSDELYEECERRTAPLPPSGTWRRQPASRRVLLAVYDATHGSSSVLSRRTAGMLTLDQRANAAVHLWRTLVADALTPAHLILAEAQSAHRKRTMVVTPTPAFKKWLAGPPSAAHAGFGSSSEQRAHPGVGGARAATADSYVDAPGVGSYDPQHIASQAMKGSSWHRSPTVSRRKSGGADGDGASADERRLPWDESAERAPAPGFYRTSSRDMAKQLAKEPGRTSPGMARPASPSPRLQGVRAARRESARGPGSYDLGGFNMSRNSAARPSSAFASKAARSSPFGGDAPMLATRHALDG